MKNIRLYILMHIILLMLSVSGILSKTAANSEWFSMRWILLYGGVLLILCVYALAWQQILKHFPLTIAYCNKAVTIVWAIIWGNLIFDEKITVNMIIGSIIVFAGIYLVVSDDAKAVKKNE